MWTRTTAEKLRAELVRLYGLIEAYQAQRTRKRGLRPASIFAGSRSR